MEMVNIVDQETHSRMLCVLWWLPCHAKKLTGEKRKSSPARSAQPYRASNCMCVARKTKMFTFLSQVMSHWKPFLPRYFHHLYLLCYFHLRRGRKVNMWCWFWENDHTLGIYRLYPGFQVSWPQFWKNEHIKGIYRLYLRYHENWCWIW